MAKPLQKLNNKHLKAIQLLVYSELSKGEIAEEVGLTQSHLSVCISDPLFQEGIREEMQRGFSQMALKARRKLDALVDDNNSQVALAAAKEVLNKAGYVETQKIEQNITTDITIEID